MEGMTPSGLDTRAENERRTRGLAMAGERGDIFDNSEMILVGASLDTSEEKMD